jgi:hypothetical protein
VEGSVPLYGFKRPTPGNEDPAYHFYAAGGPGSPHYERGLQYYPPSEGGKVQLLCYVVPWDAAPGAAYVVEWTKRGTAGHHFYTATGEPSPGPLYDRFDGQWMTW